MTQRYYFLLAFGLFTAVDLLAAGPTLNNPSSAEVFGGQSALVDGVQSICFVLGGICAIIGALVNYIAFVDGEEHVLIGVRNWFGTCLALIIFPMIIRSLAGV